MNRSTVKRLCGAGVGGLAGKKKSNVNGQLKMNIRREINVAYERFPSYLRPEWPASWRAAREGPAAGSD